MQIVDAEARTLANARRKRFLELSDVIRRQRHAERRLDSRDAPQRLERFHLMAESAFDSAYLVVQRFVTIESDRADGMCGPASGDAFDAADDPIGLKPVGG